MAEQARRWPGPADLLVAGVGLWQQWGAWSLDPKRAAAGIAGVGNARPPSGTPPTIVGDAILPLAAGPAASLFLVPLVFLVLLMCLVFLVRPAL
eukprot:gene318-9384_t